MFRSPFENPAAPSFSRIVPAAPNAPGSIERALVERPNSGDPAGSASLIETVVGQRLGGDFWAATPMIPAGLEMVVKINRAERLEMSLAKALDRVSARRLGVWLSGAAWSKQAEAALRNRGLYVWRGAADPWPILDRTRTVAVEGDDDFGLLALMAGKPTQVLFPGFLGGWGLTDDLPTIPRRGVRTLHQLVQAALVDGVRYHNPFHDRPMDCETAVSYVSEWRRIVDHDRELACCAGIAWWKRPRMRRFLAPGRGGVPFHKSAAACMATAREGESAVGVWPSRAPPGLEAAARRAGVALWRIEDGFVRSVGLGSDLLPPSSIVVDRCGIYYDPRTPSDLEKILAETEFSPRLLRRAQALMERMQALGLTKYNLAGAGFARPAARRVVLTPGQVEDDQSVLLSGGRAKGNLDLVRRVRELEPDAYIIYKPHPDVEAGNRLGAVPDADILRYANHIERKAAMSALLEGVDALHVLTSLAGFEALLRGREVVVHGQPFYCGWGLTRDLAPPLRRARQLSLTELAAGTLILYPRYLDPVTGVLCPPEVLMDRLAAQRPRSPGWIKLLRRLRRATEAVGLSRRIGVQTSPPGSLDAQGKESGLTRFGL